MRYLKLGEKASVFHDPTSNTTVKNKEIIEVDAEQLQSKRLIKAIKSGHLDYCEEKDYKKYLKSLDVDAEDVQDSDSMDYSEKSKKEIKADLNTNEKLIKNILANNGDLTEADLEGYLKDDLIEVITSGYLVEEEEEDEE